MCAEDSLADLLALLLGCLASHDDTLDRPRNGVRTAVTPVSRGAKDVRRKAAAPQVKEAPVRKPFMAWCKSEISRLSTEVDAETLVKFLLDIPQPEEVVEYVTEQLGERARAFAKAFLQKRHSAFEGDSGRSFQPVDDDSWQPSKAGKGKSKKKKFKKVSF